LISFCEKYFFSIYSITTMIYDTLQYFLLAFALGLTGALVPGPTLVATVNASLTGGWTTGPQVTLGHMLSEAILFILILVGLATVALPYTTAVAGIGGIALILFGALTIQGSRWATLNVPQGRIVTNPFMAGFLTSVANPYFWFWWLTIGSAMVITGLEGGILLALVFMAGHWSADLGWYTLVSTGISRGKTLLSDTMYRRIIAACGIFLVLFGVYYLLHMIWSL
jgi:threonine/homoserine/homoserine lactone efflux protein